MIRCSENDYRYYGESKNVSGRLASHRHMLRENRHPNRELQNDFNLYGIDAMEFTVLSQNSEKWNNRAVRQAREAEFISRDWDITYNLCIDHLDHKGSKNPFFNRSHSESSNDLIRKALKGRPNDKLGRSISMEGAHYPSIAQASRDTGIARKTIRKRSEDSAWPTYFIIEQ